MVRKRKTGTLNKKTKAQGGTMSVGADSLMGSLDMSKLLDKETLEKGRVIKKQTNSNIQISDLIQAMASSEPCLFGNSSANLMPVVEVQYDPTK